MYRCLKVIANSSWTPVVLVLYFIFDLWSLGSAHGHIHTTASSIANRFTGPSRRVNWHAAYAEVHRDSSGALTLLIPGGNFDPGTTVGRLTVFPYGPMRGFWGPTHRHVSYTIYDFQPQPLTSAELLQLRTQFVAALTPQVFPKDLSAAEIAKIQSGGITYRTIYNPLEYGHNALSLSMFAMLSWSLRFNIPKLWRKRDPTKCLHCGYSTIGLTTSTCPECGNALMEPRPSGSG